MGVVLRCPDCRDTFPWNPSKPDPRYCPLCSADLGEPKADDVICLPAFLSPKTKANDKVYADTERSSQVRMEQAAQMAGTSVSDMNALKVTDLRPTTHAGDIAAPSVAGNLAALGMKSLDDGFKGANAAEYSAAVQSGPHPNVGAKMRSMVHRSNGMVSDRPALETLQPGYRVRAQ